MTDPHPHLHRHEPPKFKLGMQLLREIERIRQFRLLPMIALLFVTACALDIHGIQEARFRLSDDSPLPSWARIPEGVTRDQVQVLIFEYSDTGPGWKERFVVRLRDEKSRPIQSVEGRAWWHPESIAAGTTNFPRWMIVEVNGAKQVYEQAQFNDLLKITNKNAN